VGHSAVGYVEISVLTVNFYVGISVVLHYSTKAFYVIKVDFWALRCDIPVVLVKSQN
jgi:hypothetical protein